VTSAPTPDFIVQSPNANPIAVEAGSTTDISCTVKNQGSGSAGSSYVRYYLSSNSSYGTSDTYLGSDYVSSLSSNGTSSESATLTIPPGTAAGTWYILFRADADDDVAEGDETNNVAYRQITVTAPQPVRTVTVTDPNGGEVWGVGDVKRINWSWAGTFTSFTIQISRNGGSTWGTIESGLPGNYTYWDWETTSPSSASCRIKVIGYYTGGAVQDISNSNFTIGQLTVTAPNGGETWQAGTTRDITWNSSNVTGAILIQPHLNGSPQAPITTSAPNTGSYSWSIPEDYPTGTTYKIGISAMGGNVSDFSDSYFTIHGLQPEFDISAQPGWTIFMPSGPCQDSSDSEYRYGPSIIINDDDSIDTWYCSPGNGGGQWDWIRYNRSTDGGVTWEYSWVPHTDPASPDVVLIPSDPPSLDQYSCCDPGVVRFGGYYYLGYTSAGNDIGRCNSVFVARSNSPSGPFHKWNGSGWGGEDPQPIIEWPCVNQDEWGASEPSFIVKDNTLYIYYEWTEVGTRVATSSIQDSNWPDSIAFYDEPAIPKVIGEDSRDVKNIDSLDLFIAVAVGSRFTDDSYIHVWKSTDGISFVSADEITENIIPEAHNVGISGTSENHIDLNFNNFIAYAYGQPPLPNEPECWPTYLNPINIYYFISDCEGDLDGDGDADGKDLSDFAYAFHYNLPSADINNDSLIDMDDVRVFAEIYGRNCQ